MKKRTPIYYLIMFLMVFVLMTVLTIVQHAKGAYLVSNTLEMNGMWAEKFTIFLYKDYEFVIGLYILDLVAMILLPAILTVVFWLIDFVILKIKIKRNKGEDPELYNKFIDEIGTELNSTHLFNVEDFRHFRENAKFQETLKELYFIYTKGPDDLHNYPHILHRFEKGTTERNAVEFLITFTEKKIKAKPVITEETNKETK